MKIKFVLGALLFIATANAADMCVSNDAVMIVLDTQVAGTALSNNQTGKTWSTQFSYGIISGIAGCYSNVGSTTGVVASDQVNITPYSSGGYCYCKMLKPMESAWVFSGRLPDGNISACARSCASSCSSNAASVIALRGGLFGNIVQ